MQVQSIRCLQRIFLFFLTIFFCADFFADPQIGDPFRFGERHAVIMVLSPRTFLEDASYGGLAVRRVDATLFSDSNYENQFAVFTLRE